MEGPDACGKTTLAAELQKLGWRYHHEGPPKDDDMLREYAKTFIRRVQENDTPIVFDRAHVGEYIYGNTVRTGDRVEGIAGLTLLNRLYVASGAQLIFCLPPKEVALINWERRAKDGEYVKMRSQISVVYDAYKQLYDAWVAGDELDTRLWGYDYTVTSLTAMTTAASRYVNRDIPFPAIGSPYAKFLLVGDKANHDFLNLPFFSVRDSSGFLWQRTQEAQIREKDLALVNAFNIDGTAVNLLDVFDALPYLKVIISLGKEANTAVRRVQYPVQHETLPHPGFWKRFRAGAEDQYVRLLQNACGTTR